MMYSGNSFRPVFAFFHNLHFMRANYAVYILHILNFKFTLAHFCGDRKVNSFCLRYMTYIYFIDTDILCIATYFQLSSVMSGCIYIIRS